MDPSAGERHGWPQYRRAARQAALFGAMLDRFGASHEAVRSGAIDAAAASCLSCPHAAACAAWLERGAPAGPPPFCANRALFGVGQ